ncbi:MAG: response regulator [Syntrophobacteraceae bacterium]|jgi:DNA-binding NtrC family response regulator
MVDGPEEEHGKSGLIPRKESLSDGGKMGVNILVIDNEESIRFSFRRFLVAEGHNVVTAKCYWEALARMNETEFELILADIFLEDGWGLDILQEVINRSLKTRVIIMTAYPSSETARDSLRMHAVAYLVKPLKQAQLLSSVNRALYGDNNNGAGEKIAPT